MIINNLCSGCSQKIHQTATTSNHCGALLKGDISTPFITAQSYPETKQTHLFLTTATTFKVRRKYWAWWVLAVVSFFVGHGFYLFGAAVMPYLFASLLIKRKHWQREQPLYAGKASKQG